MKKKIIIFSGTLNIGGVEKSLISLLQKINYEKYEVDLVLKKSGGVLEKYIPDEVNVKKSPKFFEWIFLSKNHPISGLVKSINFNLNVFRYIYYLSKGIVNRNMGKSRQQLLDSSLKTLPNFEGNYDVAIDYTGGMKSLIISKVNFGKIITWIHSDYRVFKRDKEIDKKDYLKVNAIMTVSETCHNIFIKEFPEFIEKSYVMPNILNKNYILDMARKNISFDESFTGTKILDITRLDSNKGLDIAIKACKILVDEGFNIKWYVLGEGPERSKLEALIKKNNLEERFLLLGAKENPYPYIKKCDIIVHCSLFEGKSVAIDEAMIMEKPIILTDYPTAKDQINNGVNGLICETSTVGVYEATKNLLENEHLRRKFKNNLIKYEISFNNSLEIFEEIIEK